MFRRPKFSKMPCLTHSFASHSPSTLFGGANLARFEGVEEGFEDFQFVRSGAVRVYLAGIVSLPQFPYVVFYVASTHAVITSSNPCQPGVRPASHTAASSAPSANAACTRPVDESQFLVVVGQQHLVFARNSARPSSVDADFGRLAWGVPLASVNPLPGTARASDAVETS